MSERVTTVRLLELGAGLSQRERELVRVLDRLRLMSHSQLASLLIDAASSATALSQARAVRRVLARLTADRVLARLTRRVGGLRAGSAGYVYYLGPVGQRLVAYWQGHGLTRGRLRPEPGGRYVRHRLAVSELYVQARAWAGRGVLELLAFDAEPDCWRTLVDGMGGATVLKPDAFVRLGLGAYEDRYFVEVDLGTESRGVIAAKLRSYVAYFNSGQEQAEQGVFPRVVLLTNTEERRRVLVACGASLPAEHWRLFRVAHLDQGLAVMAGQLEADIHTLGGGAS